MEQIIHLLTEYRYLILFPLAIVEGPMIAVIAGLLCTSGYLNPLYVYPVIIAGDITGDSLCYSLGRWGRSERLKKIGARLGIRPEKVDRVRGFFQVNPVRTISLSKIILGVGISGIFLAGNARVPYAKFLSICMATSIIQYTVYLGMGLLFGRAYIEINHYLNFLTSVFIVATLGTFLFFFIKSILKRL